MKYTFQYSYGNDNRIAVSDWIEKTREIEANNLKEGRMKNIISHEKQITRVEVFSYYSSDIISYSNRDNFEIKPFLENDGIWFIISRNGELISRINAKFVSIIDY